MSEELSTRDVLGQVDARLSNMEQDLRAFRSETRSELSNVRSEFGNVRSDISALTRWGLGMLFASWMTVMASIWLKS